MPKISPKVIIIACCTGCILFTLWFKSSLHPIINPSWYHAPLLPAATQPATTGITVHFHERRPLYIAYKNEARGLIANPIGQAFAFADIPFSWQETPATRQLDIIKNNTDKSCAAGWFKTPERETFGQFSLPIYQDKPFVAITRADNTLLGEMETLERVLKERRLQVLVKDGYSYGPYIDDHFRRLTPRQVITTADTQNLMRMIQTYRADYCFMTEEEAQDQLLFSGLKKSDFKLVYFSDMPRGNKRYLICSKKVDQKTMQRLNDAFRYVVHLEDNDE